MDIKLNNVLISTLILIRIQSITSCFRDDILFPLPNLNANTLFHLHIFLNDIGKVSMKQYHLTPAQLPCKLTAPNLDSKHTIINADNSNWTFTDYRININTNVTIINDKYEKIRYKKFRLHHSCRRTKNFKSERKTFFKD